MYTVIRAEIQNEYCQWAEIRRDGVHVAKVIVARLDTIWANSDNDIVQEYLDSKNCKTEN